MTRRAPTVLIAVVIASAAAVALGAQGTARRPGIDRIFAEWDRRDSPGCAMAVYKDGRIDYARGYGMASLEHGVPISPESAFYAGSVSKQFTAAAAALAIKQGRMSADDPIRRYLPELPEYASRITIRHLIHHTSGLRDYNTLLGIAGRRGDEAFDNPTVLRITARQKKLNFEPGAEYLYSNTGYTLLATIVERATATPFARYASAQIFEPLGMSVTHFHTDETRLVKGRAFGYSGRGGAFGLDSPSNERAGAGGLFTSVRDLLAWDENFYTGRVGGRDTIERLHTPGRLNDGTTLPYAWGLQLGSYRGLKIVEHSGSLGGYRAHLIRFPDRHVSVAALCNLGTIIPATLVRQVADVVIGDGFTEPKTPPVTGVIERRPDAARRGSIARAESIERYAGTYYSDEVEATFVVAARDGALTLRRETDAEPAPLEPGSGDDFRFREMTIRFERGSDSRGVVLVVDAGRVRDIRFERRVP